MAIYTNNMVPGEAVHNQRRIYLQAPKTVIKKLEQIRSNFLLGVRERFKQDSLGGMEKGTWSKVIAAIGESEKEGILIKYMLKRKFKTGKRMEFWQDIWFAHRRCD